LENGARIVARLSDVYDRLTELSLSVNDSAEFIAEWI
jgi:hypothetical protein